MAALDSAIRHPLVNDFAALKRRCPALEAIAHNGGESFRHARHVRAALEGPGAAVAVPGSRGEASREPRPARPRALHEVKSVGGQLL